MDQASQEKSLSNTLGVKISNLHWYEGSNTFSFTTDNELDAYKAAYKYQRATYVSVDDVDREDGTELWSIVVHNTQESMTA